ncbi:type I restriction endonuclease subunit R [Deefgea piscis]|uniref:type I restriction endonuclease subunit R n=1 Tax=Deefgea piscis TaxID=2739061 RepID=UPI001C80E828|nr:HsdR family type I site-specific deoxyribonuclease [Deefgea piscis]QZA80121.1 HsdR family type I site-specific deoxyribonuclease [Deefgea piscis]
MTFTTEAAFETALINELKNKGWEDQVLRNPTEADLLQNWADILFQNNRDIDRLNDVPLTDSEMQQIVEQIRELKTPLKLNGFINGKTVSITRDNPKDPLHFGKEISLKIYDRHEIAAGQSRYQIVQQPKFAKSSKILNDRRGDLLLLINGMPLIHIELKRSGKPVSNAYNQIVKYSAESVFTGLFALVQVFVAMEPSEMVYFANPGMDGRFNKDFYFHWADFDNEPVNDWKGIASRFLSIPMAHQLIGFYTVADHSDGVLKVMRSYQYYAANAISDKVSKTNWADRDRLGGYVWHTTGSGKTMTSFKSAQLIAHSKDADKVIFLMDRIELGVQSLQEYKGFAGEGETVQATENTGVLISKLKSTDPANTLIVSSIQKMSNISAEANDDGVSLQSHDIALINNQRIVFIMDEAHRSTFGDMLITIKKTFPSAIFFGFTGTPIQDENQKNLNTTATVFGNELHRYSIADGIRDKNVLGFDPYKVMTYTDTDLKTAVALHKAKAKTESEALADPKKKAVFNRYMRDVTMAGYFEDNGIYVKGIEDELPKSQYTQATHQEEVVKDIVANWTNLSQNSKFHAIFATSSIKEAIEYYRHLKLAAPTLKISALFDPYIDEDSDYEDGPAFKQAGLVEIITDYNAKYGQDFNLGSHAQFKKDLAARLAHKRPYLRLEKDPEQQIDLLIVVDQMLTGFDSKWLNTLYLDKVLRYENIIQAFSRTNRLYLEHEKPFGTIRYYRYPHSMERYIEEAIKLYSGDKAIGLFVDKLPSNLKKINDFYDDIAELFRNAGVANFEKLPADKSVCGQFAKLFAQLNQHLEAAKVQGFTWDKLSYPSAEHPIEITLKLDENTYLALALRYKELSSGGGGGGGTSDVPFDISGHLTEIDTGKIDADYMNSRFEKYLKTIQRNGVGAADIQKTMDELHKSFATLTQEEQKFANIFLNDVQRGDATLEEGKTFRDYITEYLANAKNEQITELVELLSKTTDIAVFTDKLNRMMNAGITAANINEFGRLDTLKSYVDKAKAKAHFEETEGAIFTTFQINMKVDKLLQDFIMKGGFELEQASTCTA